jgi:hypothetical protein
MSFVNNIIWLIGAITIARGIRWLIRDYRSRDTHWFRYPGTWP